MFQKTVLVFIFSTFFVLQSYASDSWSSPETIDNDLRLWDGAEVALDPQGNATAVFECYITSGDNIDIWLVAATKPANGTWSTPVPLTQKVDGSNGFWINAKVCVDNNGNAVAVWNFPYGDKEAILSATLPYGSSQWVPAPSPLATNIERLGGPFLNLDQKGQALAVWGNSRDGKYYVESARLSKSQWKANDPLEIPYSFQSMETHVNSTGTAWLIWMKGLGDNVAASTLSPNSKQWNQPETLSEKSGISYNGPQIVSDLQGNVLATWQEYDQKNLVFVAYRRPKGLQQWKKTNFQNVPTHIYTRGWLSLDPKGNALFVWKPDDKMLLNSSLSAGSSAWTQPVFISSEDIFYWQGTSDSKGNRLLSWIKWDDDTLKAATLPFGQTAWTAPVAITTASGALEDCQLSENGSAIILFSDPWTTLQDVTGRQF